VPELAHDLIGGYLSSVELLGQRTGELHLALASAPEDPSFSPEPFTPFYLRSLYQSMRGLVAQTFPLLRNNLRGLPPDVRADAETLLAQEDTILRRFRSVLDRRITGMRIRCHNDYHLGQVLYTGKDFVIIDFEGEPARPLSERRLKRPPVRDEAAMLRSFHYAVYTALFRQIDLGIVHKDRLPAMEGWARFWYSWVGAAFLRSYLRVVSEVPVLLPTGEDLQALLDAYILDKAVYELGYDLNNRPHMVRIPISGILDEIGASA
jgi:maltose alpha-D-glucosyltransferase/alpha-amylase